MNLTRRGLLLGAGALGVTGLTGCIGGSNTQTTSGSTAKDEGTVEWWTINLQKSFKDYIQQMIDVYTKDHPKVSINWVDVPGQDINTKLLAAIASGNTPDAVNITASTIGLFGAAMTPMSDLLSSSDLDAYIPALTSSLTVDGHLAALPWYSGGGSLGFYRKSVLSKAGFDADNPPKTLDDALELGLACKKKADVYGTNVIPSFKVMVTEGITMLSEDRSTAAFNTPQAAQILEKYKKYFDEGAIAPGAVGADDRNYEQTLTNKQIAFMAIDISSNLKVIEQNAPEVYQDIVVTDPAVGASGKTFLFDQQVFGVPKKAKNPAAAAEWIKFVTSPDNELAFCKQVPIYPSTKAALDDPFFTTSSGSAPSDVARTTLVKQFPTLANGALGTGNDANLGSLFDEQVRSFMTGKQSAAEALGNAEDQWNKELAK